MQTPERTFRPGPLRGEARLPGDKSISHRAAIVAAAFAEPTRISGINTGRDVAATLGALRAVGAQVERDDETVTIRGGALRSPECVLDCMNSGSTARMVMGLCAGAAVEARFDGDASLRRRPMEHVAAQLRAFGAHVVTSDGRLPATVRGTRSPETRAFILLEPSAQVKSALLFAGLFAGVPVAVHGDRGSRDHTERLLEYLGATIERSATRAALVAPPVGPRPIAIPRDPSAAAFFATAAAIAPGSEIAMREVCVNPTRTGLFDALRAMGAGVEYRNERICCGEPVADVVVRHAPLRGISVDAATALRAIDEVPLIAVAAAFALGRTTITGIRALRTKESDRIRAVERLLRAVGIAVEETPSGIAIEGGTPSVRDARVQTDGDHRIAMAAAVLACACGPLHVDDADCIAVSFPEFGEILDEVRAA